MRQAMGTPQPLGAEMKKDGMNFAVAVPAGKTCELLLYKKREAEPVKVFELPEEDGIGEVRFLKLEGIPKDICEYNFRIGGKVTVDWYAKSISRTNIFGADIDLERHQMRGAFWDDAYDWEGDRPLQIPYNKVIAYSLHVRGFTRHPSSGVKQKGTFAGVVEKLDYLKELGVNQIQCMPVYEFQETVDKKPNYWGYGSAYYFAPKTAYSASGDACRELKDMVKACHKAGIEVVLEMPFDTGILPQTAIACLKHYMLEYHVDGFVINPYNTPWEMVTKDPLLRAVKIMRKNDWFQNTMRRFMKSDGGMVWEVMEALKHNSCGDGECNYITSHTGFTMNDLVSYNEKHNEMNGERNEDGTEQNYSWNCGEEGPSRKRAVMALRSNQIRNAFFLLLMSQGTPCILAGDEFRNTQSGNNNVYCQDNEVGWLNWKNLKKETDLYEYVKGLITLRKEHPSLCKATVLLGQDKTGSGIPDVSYHGEYAWQVQKDGRSRELGVMYNDVVEEKQDICYIAYNMHWNKREFALPVLQGKGWYKVLDTSNQISIGTKEFIEAKSIRVNERSIVMLIAE